MLQEWLVAAIPEKRRTGSGGIVQGLCPQACWRGHCRSAPWPLTVLTGSQPSGLGAPGNDAPPESPKGAPKQAALCKVDARKQVSQG